MKFKSWIKDNKGIALIITMTVLVVLLILGSVLILRSVTEKRSSDEERRSFRPFTLPRQAGMKPLTSWIRWLIPTC